MVNDIKASKRKNIFIKVLLIPEIGILIPLVILILLFYSLNNIFLSFLNITNVLRSLSYYGIIGVGMTICLVAGEVDISVGSVAGLSAVLCGVLLRDGYPIPFAIIIGLLVGISIGFINGIITIKGKIPSLITTLGMLSISRGLVSVVTKGYNVYPFPEGFNNFGKAEPLGISYSFVIFIIIVIIGAIFFNRTIWGRRVFSVGGNTEAAKLAGINTNWVKISAFIITSFCAALSGIILSARIACAPPTLGLGWEFKVIAAVVIGGASLGGGIGSIIGAVIGATIISILDSGMILANVSPYWQSVVVGCILILAVGIDTLRRERIRRI